MNRIYGAFTLVEMLIALTIFVIVMGLVLASVTGLFRTSSQVQSLVDTEQRQRMCFLRLSREIASITRINYPGHKFKGNQNELFFIFAREDGLSEAHYACSGSSLEKYSQEPADFNWDTFKNKETCLNGISSCSFSYDDGDKWQDSWAEEKGTLPVMIKITFQSQGDDRVREFIVHVPVSS